MKRLRLFKRCRIDVDAFGLEVVLRTNRPLRLAASRGGRILCTSGCAWVTAVGVRDDIFLRDGDAWDVVGEGLVLIEAVGSATVALCE